MRHSGLPVEVSSLVGRGPQIEAVLDGLREHRVVTLTGPGGCGKTRLALRVATLAAGRFGAGAWLTELASLTDPALVPGSVAEALGAPERDAANPMAGLVRALADRAEAGKVDDLRVVGGTMMLCSFAHSALRRVAFEDVNLREASFLETRLTSVSFSGCDLTGADFRGARLKECTIRGSSLDGVVGVESLRGLTMRWVDLVGSVEALAAALGIGVEGERSETF